MRIKNNYFYTLRENVKDEDSTSGNFIEVSSSGFVQSGKIELISGTLDKANVPVTVTVGSL